MSCSLQVCSVLFGNSVTDLQKVHHFGFLQYSNIFVEYGAIFLVRSTLEHYVEVNITMIIHYSLYKSLIDVMSLKPYNELTYQC